MGKEEGERGAYKRGKVDREWKKVVGFWWDGRQSRNLLSPLSRRERERGGRVCYRDSLVMGPTPSTFFLCGTHFPVTQSSVFLVQYYSA